MKIAYIIPTVGRSSISDTISSILREDVNARILIERNGTAGENRNRIISLQLIANNIPKLAVDWLGFIDDDDYYNPGYLAEIDAKYDIIIMKMLQDGLIVPRDSDLRFGNVGINFMIKSSFLSNILVRDGAMNESLLFDNSHGEDWRFIEGLLKYNPKIKITEDVFYVCSSVNHKLPPHLRTAPI